MDDATSRNATTTLNPGVGGDVMDERSVTQEDNSTVAKRQVVALGHKDNRLISFDQPLPTAELDTAQLLGMILEEVRAMRMMMAMLVSEVTGSSTTDISEGEI